ncbi:uncharacterized protein HKW66_Vig0228890 [Vigna angularis]|uniref:Uncharacterized protein n=1 Tax=Phaseolus angularis TaxID=3914 RepID=A0A8T0KAI0_PHAAN|nr:uncharacterized protein HKW66_Vig0228890 [Vigna angularis]
MYVVTVALHARARTLMKTKHPTGTKDTNWDPPVVARVHAAWSPLVDLSHHHLACASGPISRVKSKRPRLWSEAVAVGGGCWRLMLAVAVGGCCWRWLLVVKNLRSTDLKARLTRNRDPQRPNRLSFQSQIYRSDASSRIRVWGSVVRNLMLEPRPVVGPSLLNKVAVVGSILRR